MNFERSGTSSFLELLSLRALATSSPAPGRGKNDDAFLFAGPGLPFAERQRNGYLFGVADGVSAGGHGAAASNQTVDAIRRALADPRATDPANRPAVLEDALLSANAAVFARESSQGVLSGCTASFVWLWEDEEDDGPGFLRGAWVHVGDSRIYTLGAKGARLWTLDDKKGYGITRWVGMPPAEFSLQKGAIRLDVGDVLVTMTDGVWEGAAIDASLRPADGRLLDNVLEDLIRRTRRGGSRDDATVVLVRVEGG